MTKREKNIIYKACEALESGSLFEAPYGWSCRAIDFAIGGKKRLEGPATKLAKRYAKFYEKSSGDPYWLNEYFETNRIKRRIILLLLFAEVGDIK